MATLNPFDLLEDVESDDPSLLIEATEKNVNLKCRARYGVQLENGPFDKRTADFLWMMIFGAVSLLCFVWHLLGISG